ncbi:pleckstrin homology-like domain family A member 2 isoform 1-T2 [Mantella aurantiaca]
MMNRSTIASPVAIKEGDLEKRSDSFLQLWKKRRCVLTADGLHLYTDPRKRGKAKILRFDSLAKLECVERKGERVYFTLVTMDGQEIDFRCRERSRWNAEITLALVGFQNRKAVQELRARKEHQARDAGERLRSWGP